MTDTEFLVRAQTFTVNLSILLLLLLFLIFRRFFPPLPSLALLVATAFGVFLYRAGKAQTELLFYFVSFCAFVLLLRMFVSPRWPLAVLAGATTGVAHLTKASVLPALGVWALAFGAQVVWSRGRSRWSRLGILALVPAVFLAVVFPYIQTSKRVYGAYFYNVNSTFVMWCDSSSQAYEFVAAHALADEWRKLPADQLPSLRKYWREHSIGQIARRIAKGSLDVATQHVRPIGYYKFVIALLLGVVFLGCRQPAVMREILAQHRFSAAFCLMFFATYFLLYAWYDAIITDVRFVLSIFLPFLFAASLVVLRLGRDRVISLAGRRIAFEQFFAGVFLSLALIDVFYNARGLLR
jgi:hypothetical protein